MLFFICAPRQVIFAVILLILAPALLFGAPASNSRVGIFSPGASLEPVSAGMQEGLAKLGYLAGKNIIYVFDDAKGGAVNPSAQVANLLSNKPDVLFTVSTDYTQVAKRATSTIPIVFSWVGDPVRVGLIESYPYSKNNLTGVTSITDALCGKRLQILLEILPKAKRILTLVSPNESVSVSSIRSLEPVTQKLGVQLIRRDVTSKEEIIKLLEETPRGSLDAIFHVPSNLVRMNIDLLAKKAKKERIPLAVHEEALLAYGAHISYGANLRLVGMQAAGLVGKILQGASPGKVMVESPDRFFLAINQGAAKQIGLTIPRQILERADRLVQQP